MGLVGRLFRRSKFDRFAAAVLRRLRAAGIRNARYHRDEFAIEYRSYTDREPAWMYLANLYAECERDPATKAERIDQFVAAFAALPTMPDTWELASESLRPVLRGASFGRGGASRYRAVLRRPALPFLDEMVVVDQPASMGYVTEGMWGVSPEQVFATARANLAAQPPVLPAIGLDNGPAVLRFFDNGDSYFVSRMLIDGWLANLADRVGGHPVAFAPDPGSLIVAAEEPETLKAIFDAVFEEYEQAGRPLSPMGYTVNDYGQLVPYSVPAQHPLAGVVRRAERSLATAEYEAQRTVLRSEGEDGYYVASCMLMTRPDDSAFTVASWRRDQPTLLPAVDYVALSDDSGGFRQGQAGRRLVAGELDAMVVPWGALVAEDILVEAVEYRPARYRVGAWPSAPVLARLRERSGA